MGRPPGWCFLLFVALGFDVVLGAEPDLISSLIPGANVIRGCKPNELNKLTEDYEFDTGNAPKGATAEVVKDEIFGQGWGKHRLSFVILHRIEPSYFEVLRNQSEWEYHEYRGGFPVWRTGPKAHSWEYGILADSVSFWGPSKATQAFLSNLNRGANVLQTDGLSKTRQKLRELRDKSHCYEWRKGEPGAVDEDAVDEDAKSDSHPLMTSMGRLVNEYWVSHRYDGDAQELEMEFVTKSQEQALELATLLRDLELESDQLLLSDDEDMQGFAIFFTSGMGSVAVAGRSVTLSARGSHDEFDEAGKMLDQPSDRKKRKQGSKTGRGEDGDDSDAGTSVQ